jgi:predicted metal-dependent hydrolase
MPNSSPLIEVRRSAKRRRTVSAFREGDKIVVLVPARMSRADERRYVAELVERVTRRETELATKGARGNDGVLMARALQLSTTYLAGQPKPVSVRWVTNMKHRWGSCTPADGTIRLSHRLRQLPDWVIDYVLVHELSHLLHSGHGPEFWASVSRYPRAERARGFLEGLAIAAQVPGWSSCEPPSGSEPSVGDEPSAGGGDSDDSNGSELRAGRSVALSSVDP